MLRHHVGIQCGRIITHLDLQIASSVTGVEWAEEWNKSIASRPLSFGKSILSFLPAGRKSKMQSPANADANESASPWSRPNAKRCSVSAISYRSQASCARSVFMWWSLDGQG